MGDRNRQWRTFGKRWNATRLEKFLILSVLAHCLLLLGFVIPANSGAKAKQNRADEQQRPLHDLLFALVATAEECQRDHRGQAYFRLQTVGATHVALHLCKRPDESQPVLGCHPQGGGKVDVFEAGRQLTVVRVAAEVETDARIEHEASVLDDGRADALNRIEVIAPAPANVEVRQDHDVGLGRTGKLARGQHAGADRELRRCALAGIGLRPALGSCGQRWGREH